MIDLYVGHRINEFGFIDSWNHPSRSDVLEWLGGLTRRENLELLGWELCGECSGSDCMWDGDHEGRDCEPCGHCVEGYEPPASQVEAAANGIKALNDVPYSDESWKTEARAALIAAMKGVSE